jgi:hypothetical protein
MGVGKARHQHVVHTTMHRIQYATEGLTKEGAGRQ